MSKSILIVDDSSTMRKIIMRTIRMSGLEIASPAEAGNGIEALEQLKNQQYDFMLCDINMPEMNGKELLTKVRENPDYNGTKIVMVSTESSENLIDELMQIGANGYITKPFTPERFYEKLTPLWN